MSRFICFLFSFSLFLPGFTHADAIEQYDCFETRFKVPIPYENPYFLSSITVDAEVQSPDRELKHIPCFYETMGFWKMRFTPTQVGLYSYKITADNHAQSEIVKSGTFAVEASDHPGFLRISQKHKRHFAFENGESYFPLGENLGWVGFYHTDDIAEEWEAYLDECQAAGMNWIRIWMCPWGMTEIVWNENQQRYFGYEKYSYPNAQLIDFIFRKAEERGIYIQWCINHHGQYSLTSNPIWDANPYNVANGGFLEKPGEFFTSPQMAKHYKDRLRYLVARWGYSTHLLAWEFFNEVDITTFDSWADVIGWHETMSAHLRSIDPYNHLQTTSAAWQTHKTFTIEGMDYLQSHAYVPDVIGVQTAKAERTQAEYPNKPHFFGELSYDASGPNTEDKNGVILHNQLWASVHSWDSGTAMTWWWDNWVRLYDLYSHFEALSKYVEGIDWAAENLTPMPAQVAPHPRNKGSFFFSPKIGWGTTKAQEFTIRDDGTVENLDQCTEFVHGSYHRDMAANPIFILRVDEPTEFGFEIEKVARAGA
ncbi:DUF5060 domain-containing protein, partial [bacterium]|nr:DUF5060 domain-containing protein [bacterium]